MPALLALALLACAPEPGLDAREVSAARCADKLPCTDAGSDLPDLLGEWEADVTLDGEPVGSGTLDVHTQRGASAWGEGELPGAVLGFSEVSGLGYELHLIADGSGGAHGTLSIMEAEPREPLVISLEQIHDPGVMILEFFVDVPPYDDTLGFYDKGNKAAGTRLHVVLEPAEG